VLGVSGFVVFFSVLRTSKKHQKQNITSTFPIWFTAKNNKQNKKDKRKSKTQIKINFAFLKNNNKCLK